MASYLQPSASAQKTSGDGGALYRRSRELLLAHEDKSYAGAIITSLSIPRGEIKGDEDLGGYHLVWTRYGQQRHRSARRGR
jgi:glucoamylase